MAEIVYALCALTSLLCAVLLLRSYVRGRARLLLWSGLCFVGLAINNVFLFLDLVVVTEVDLRAFRDVSAFAGVSILVYGLVWDTK
jgi:hypothetical protein